MLFENMLNYRKNMSICPTTGKNQYQTEKDAEAGLTRMKERIPSYDGEPYYCLYCGNYHFGKLKDKPKNKKV